MPTVRLLLKQREDDTSATFRIALMREVVKRREEEAKDALYAMFKPYANGMGEGVHDTHWLKIIINWAGEKGLPLTEMAKWFGIAKKVNRLKGQGDEELLLSEREVDLLFARMKDDKFTITGLQPSFVEFMLDFCDATGRQFDTMVKEKDEEPALA